MDATPLQTIAEWAGASLIQGDGSKMITRLSTDSRSIQPGDLFLALTGEKFDGHGFVAEVASRGAIGAVVSREVTDVPAGFALLRVEDTLLALQQIAGRYRATLPVRVTCITGSNGKTSTKDFTASVLGQQYRVLKTQGNLNNHIGVPQTLLQLSAADECAVVEIGMNHPGEIAPLAALAVPRTAIITNVGVAHIEYMGSREAIALEKGSLAEPLPADGCLILDATNDFAESIAGRTTAKTVLAGVDAGEVCGSEVQLDAGGSRFTIHARGESVSAFLPVPGMHMVRNALLAVAAGLEHGLTLQQCADGLAATRLTKGRVERKVIHGLEVIDDSYNANPDSMIAALQTIAQLPGAGRRFAVLGRMGELGGEAENGHRAVGAAAAREQIGCVISVGSEANWISEAARAGGVQQVFNTPDTDEAVKLLRSLARPGDIILVKGSRSSRMERVVEGLAL